jgi:hypothetical protein
MKTNTKKIQLIKESLRFRDCYHVKLDGKLMYSSEDYHDAMVEYERLRDEHSSRSRIRVLVEEEL